MSPDALAAAVERVVTAMRACRLCPRRCGSDRMAGPQGALCALGSEGWLYKELLSHGEEAVISPTWLLDLGGCSMRCRFCSEWQHVVRPETGPAVPLDPTWFAATLSLRKRAGARSVSFVGGDPTVSLYAILRALAASNPADWLPIVWNCNGLIGDEAFVELAPLVDCWLLDLKFASNRCANRLTASDEGAYRRQVDDSLDRIHSQITRERPADLPPLLIRHLLLPGHLECCTLPLIAEIAQRWPLAVLNLMTTYLPFGPALAGDDTAPELRQINQRGHITRARATLAATLPTALLDGRAMS